jgi:hypothetical protein
VPAAVRYIRYRAWWLATGYRQNELDYAYLAENLLETWVPPDRSDEWLLRRSLTGQRRWLVDDESQMNHRGWPTGEWRAPYGDFYAHDMPSESPPGQWHRPNPAWLAELPRDPALLLDELRAGLPKLTMLIRRAAEALRGGQLPADLVIAMYQALASLPDVTVHEAVRNLDGRTGSALVTEQNSAIDELIVDVNAGEFLGERSTLTEPIDAIPAGTVTTFTATSTAWVDALGDTPN